MLTQDEIDARTGAVYENSGMVFPEDTEESIAAHMAHLETQWTDLGFSEVEKENTRRFYYMGHNRKEWIDVFCYLQKLSPSNIYHNCTHIIVLYCVWVLLLLLLLSLLLLLLVFFFGFVYVLTSCSVTYRITTDMGVAELYRSYAFTGLQIDEITLMATEVDENAKAVLAKLYPQHIKHMRS